MCVCVCVCVCVSMYVCMCVCMHAYMYTDPILSLSSRDCTLPISVRRTHLSEEPRRLAHDCRFPRARLAEEENARILLKEHILDHLCVAAHMPAHAHCKPDDIPSSVSDGRNPMELCLETSAIVATEVPKVVNNLIDLSGADDPILGAEEDALPGAPRLRPTPFVELNVGELLLVAIEACRNIHRQ